ncbi:HAD family hydrolase [Abyssisolibacter fermentans]|uniref:HAD family hydrolase n=1 Tax=Abyssisolibacter fermentans TaxID=1766203 RepID=UPI00082A241E|nr:HAD hydrolase family protein [Abyssisolibacter fermentans]
MLYASDLDRTLIYSKKLINEEILNTSDVRIVEKFEGYPISYMTQKSIDLLKSIKDRLLFVPVTTRTLEQFRRIKIVQELDLKYSVVANGGIILENNKISEIWRKTIFRKITDNCININDAIKEFERIKSDVWVKKLRIADDMFFYCIIEEDNIPEKELQAYSKWLETQNWITTRHGRKLYFIPRYVNKGDAVKFIAQRENISDIAASGDSSLDLDMAKVCNYFIVPKHGGICDIADNKMKCMNYTTVKGILAAEEILKLTADYFNI